jgi:hypothetical protein
MLLCFIKEPLKLFGEGSYALSAVKEISGTDNFLKMDEGVKKCQNRESLQECQATQYMRKGLEECKCTPYELRNYSKTVRCVSCVLNVKVLCLGNPVHAAWLRMLQIYPKGFRQMPYSVHWCLCCGGKE